ncbi:ABC transporter substrate-binding protein [Limobrevibacterium gyesilva]|uniref:ABC transporter substrate-binding protein n=1 Tax=Limobrevibacterium gyesilva TaxID=2991712 RepID=A0AA41YXV7_9PROT|nr:ABC transporter substrate-binding protein [Limobrevibacterium gyesilva]MCW3477297.1 ABC transporter substrate-binding protein [Limobrevibacterium gyesilva]
MLNRRALTRRGLLGGAGVAVGAGALAGGARAELKGDTLVIGQAGDIVSLDPAYRVDTLTGNVQKHLYDTVLTRRPDMGVGPGAAEAVERIGPTAWRLRLRPDRRFANGEPVDAQCVQYTLARLNAPETRSPIRSFFEPLNKVTVESPTSALIETETPDALFLARMTNLQLVPPRATEKLGLKFGEAPIGSGPYTLDHWRRNDEVVLNANPTYGGPAPRFARLVIRPVPEEIARISAVKTGQAQLVTNISPNQADALQRAGAVQVLRTASNRVMVVQFNKMAAPADDPRFRRAVGLAINRDEIIRGLLKGFASPVRGIFGAAIQGVPQDVRGDFDYDPDQARRIIQELGLAGREIELAGAAGRYPLDRECALAIGAQLRRIGLQVKVRTSDYGSFAEDIKTNRVAPVFIQPHGNVWLDPLPQIIAFFDSRGHWSGWRDPALDAMIARAGNAEGDARLARVGDLIRKLHDDAIAVPLYADEVIYAAVPELKWSPRADDLIVASEVS